MATQPKLAMIPSGYKDGKLYSVLPSDGVGDFDVTRGSIATRINKDGLIETVTGNTPRLNYPLIDGVGSGCPSLLLEPQSTNLFPRSEDFINAVWQKNQSSILANNIISPDGTLNASKLVEDNSNNFHRIIEDVILLAGTHSHSVFAKAGERKYFVLRNNINGSNLNACFDLENGVVIYNGFDEAKIEYYGNGWYKCSIIDIDPSGGSTSFSLMTSDIAVSSNSIPSYQGDGTSGIYIFGAQIEQSSYATSYIPNFGTALGVTRLADTANSAGNASTFNDSEGVLFAEISALDEIGTNQSISISNGSTSNRILFRYNSTNQIRVIVISDTDFVFDKTVNISNLKDYNKFSIKYKENDFALWINGFELGTDNSGLPPVGLSALAFHDGSGVNDFYGNTKQIQYYNTALTDLELETLTSYTSFNAMALAQNYTI